MPRENAAECGRKLTVRSHEQGSLFNFNAQPKECPTGADTSPVRQRSRRKTKHDREGLGCVLVGGFQLMISSGCCRGTPLLDPVDRGNIFACRMSFPLSNRRRHGVRRSEAGHEDGHSLPAHAAPGSHG